MNENSVKELMYVFAASLVFASAGALLAWPAAALPRLSASPPLDAPALSSAQGSWCVAALHAGQVLGAVPGAVLAARAGRRVTLLLCAPPLAAAWLLLAGAGALGDAGVAAVLGARALGGFTVGVAFVAGPLYAAEAASARLRGAAGALVQLALSGGQLLVYCGGAWLSLRHLALAAATLPVLFAAAFWCAPETPHWLLRRGERGRAERALRTLRGGKVTGEAVESELAQLEAFACAEAVDVAAGGLLDVEATVNGPYEELSDVQVGSGEDGKEEVIGNNHSNEGKESFVQDENVEMTSNFGKHQVLTKNSNTSVPQNLTEEENSDSRVLSCLQSVDSSNKNNMCSESQNVDKPGQSTSPDKEIPINDIERTIPSKGLLRDPVFRRSFLLLVTLVLLQSFGTATFLFPYTTHVLTNAPLSPDVAYVVLGSIQILGSLASPWLLSRCGRRPALLLSASFAALACAARVVCLRLFPSPAGAFTALCTAAFAASLALGPLPLALAAELAPSAARGAVVAAVTALGAAGSFAAQRAYEALWLSGSPHVASYASTACCGVAAWLAFALLPEVHDLSLLDAQAALRRDLHPPRKAPARASLAPTVAGEQQGPPPEEETEVLGIGVGRIRLAFVRRERARNDVPLQAVSSALEGNSTH